MPTFADVHSLINQGGRACDVAETALRVRGENMTLVQMRFSHQCLVVVHKLYDLKSSETRKVIALVNAQREVLRMDLELNRNTKRQTSDRQIKAAKKRQGSIDYYLNMQMGELLTRDDLGEVDFFIRSLD
jgi:microsomal dipeptidase-like Zn-dependent dipeptidase